MDPNDEGVEALLSATQVGDTIRMRFQKAQISADVRDRVSPVLERPAGVTGPALLRGFVKDPAGIWDLEGMTSANGSPIVEVLLRRAASAV
jgi:hypothetical protein